VAAPQEAEGGHRHQEVRTGRHLGGVVVDEAAIVVDVLQHVHHQHEVAVGRAGVAAVEDGLAAFAVVAVARIADVHAQGRLSAGLGQQLAGEKPGASADIEDAPGSEPADHAPECCRLRPVVPVPTDPGA
jgi:hypothetical protein